MYNYNITIANIRSQENIDENYIYKTHKINLETRHALIMHTG